jgi:prefoldin alpha subunit
MSAGGDGKMQELQKQLEAIDDEISSVRQEIEGLRNEKHEMDDAIDALDRIESGDTVQVPLGGDAYVRAEVQDVDEVVVSLGGGYAAERDRDGAIDSLEQKQETLDDRISDLQSDISELEEESAKIEQRAQQMQQQQLQQLQQQMQGQGQEPDSDDE